MGGDRNEDHEVHGAGGGLLVHATAYLAVNAVLIVIWAMTVPGAELSQVPDLLTHPSQARAANFFPIFVILGWGIGLAIHAAVWVACIPRRARRRRAAARRRRARREAQSQIVGALGDGRWADAAVAGISLVDGDTAAPRVRRDATRSRSSRRRDHDRPRRDREAPADGVRSNGKGPRASSSRRDGAAADAETGPAEGRGWVAVMFTDLVDSTPLTEHFGDEVWAQALLGHRALVRSIIASHDGTEVGTQGDSFLVRFDHPQAAADAAVAIQRRLLHTRSAATEAATAAMHLRIGLHAGEVVHREDDLVGRVINLAARVTAAAEPDEILVTEPFADQLGGDVALVDRGLRTLKGIDRPRHVLAVAWMEAPSEVDLRDPEHH